MAVLDTLNRFKVVRQDISWSKTIVESGFTVAQGRSKEVVPWLISQAITMLIMYKLTPAKLTTLPIPKPSGGVDIVPTDNLFNFLSKTISQATPKGIEKLNEVQKKKVIATVQSKWINTIAWVPSLVNDHLGSFAITFIADATNNKKPLITPPWFTFNTFLSFQRTVSKGKFYLEYVAIGNTFNLVKHLANSFALATKFKNELRYYEEIKELNDHQAFTYIKQNSIEGVKLFPYLDEALTKLSIDDLSAIDGAHFKEKLGAIKEAEERLQFIDETLKHRNDTITFLARTQRNLKRVARLARNPKATLQYEIKNFASLITPHYTKLNTIYDIAFKGAKYTKQKIGTALKIDAASFFTMPTTKQKVLLSRLKWEKELARLRNDWEQVDTINSKINSFKTRRPPSRLKSVLGSRRSSHKSIKKAVRDITRIKK